MLWKTLLGRSFWIGLSVDITAGERDGYRERRWGRDRERKEGYQVLVSLGYIVKHCLKIAKRMTIRFFN